MNNTVIRTKESNADLRTATGLPPNPKCTMSGETALGSPLDPKYSIGRPLSSSRSRSSRQLDLSEPTKLHCSKGKDKKYLAEQPLLTKLIHLPFLLVKSFFRILGISRG